MHYRYVLTSLILMTSLYSSAQNRPPKTDRERMNLKGPVKSVDDRSYVFYNGEAAKNTLGENAARESDFYVEFNKAGNKVRTEERGSGGHILSVSTFDYDGSGRLLRQTVDMGFMIETTENRYDGSGICTESTYTTKWKDEPEQNTSVVQTHTYDEKGRITQTLIPDPSKPAMAVTYTYDPNGSLAAQKKRGYVESTTVLEQEQYDQNGHLAKLDNGLNQKKFSYDEKNNRKTISVDHNGAYTCSYVYDEQGNWIEQRQEKQEGNRSPAYIIYRSVTYWP